MMAWPQWPIHSRVQILSKLKFFTTLLLLGHCVINGFSTIPVQPAVWPLLCHLINRLFPPDLLSIFLQGALFCGFATILEFNKVTIKVCHQKSIITSIITSGISQFFFPEQRITIIILNHLQPKDVCVTNIFLSKLLILPDAQNNHKRKEWRRMASDSCGRCTCLIPRPTTSLS